MAQDRDLWMFVCLSVYVSRVCHHECTEQYVEFIGGNVNPGIMHSALSKLREYQTRLLAPSLFHATPRSHRTALQIFMDTLAFRQFVPYTVPCAALFIHTSHVDNTASFRSSRPASSRVKSRIWREKKEN